jgi:hypothetical protein
MQVNTAGQRSWRSWVNEQGLRLVWGESADLVAVPTPPPRHQLVEEVVDVQGYWGVGLGLELVVHQAEVLERNGGGLQRVQVPERLYGGRRHWGCRLLPNAGEILLQLLGRQGELSLRISPKSWNFRRHTVNCEFTAALPTLSGYAPPERGGASTRRDSGCWRAQL